MSDQRRIQIIKRASWIGILGNGLLALLKVGAGILSGSMAVIADGIDSITDIFTSMITLITARIINEPPDMEHPWGHTRAETIATKGLSFIIFFAGSQLFLSTGKHFLSGELRELPGKAALVVTGISIAGKIFLTIYKHRAGRKADSSMLIADAKNMQNDIYLSLAVLLGLTGTYILDMPFIDSLTGFLLSLWIMKSAWDLFMETSMELMDSMADPSVYRTVFEAAAGTRGVVNPHRARIRKLNTLYDIDLDIEVDGQLRVWDAHAIAAEVEANIKAVLPDVFDIMVHVEPVGNLELGEQYGLCPEDLEEP
jgi:cation diffusion facilitator family transporter